MLTFDNYYESKRRQVNEALKTLLKEEPAPVELKRAMNYSLLAGGKRLRPILCLMVDDVIQKKNQSRHHRDVMAMALTAECIHTYSLIHDDLPCMDDDDLRRGRPTCHMKFGEARAILAGDALLTYAFALLGRLQSPSGRSRCIQVIAKLAEAAGCSGMVGGQILDLESENKTISLKKLIRIHRLKTGALIEASVLLPLLYRGVSKNIIRHYQAYAEHIGIAFQIVDDILDVTASSKTLGKPAGSDKNNCKSTYVSLLGLKRAEKEAQKVISKAKAALGRLPGDTLYLEALSDYIQSRVN